MESVEQSPVPHANTLISVLLATLRLLEESSYFGTSDAALQRLRMGVDAVIAELAVAAIRQKCSGE